MRIRGFGFATFAVLCLTAYSQAEAPPEETQKAPAVVEVLAVQESLLVAVQRGDTGVLADILSKDVVVSDPSNSIRRRDELLSIFGGGQVVYRSVNQNIDFAGNVGDLVVVMGTEITVLEAAPDGSPWGPGATLHRRFTNVYREEPAGWKLIVKQSTVFRVDRP